MRDQETDFFTSLQRQYIIKAVLEGESENGFAEIGMQILLFFFIGKITQI
jgi:hypothetical protein